MAEELQADALLVDDGAARLEAGRRNIPVLGTLGILDLAAEHREADGDKFSGWQETDSVFCGARYPT